MKIVIAPDSFKGSLSALEAAEAIERGIKLSIPHAETIKVPIADGGEGTLDSLITSLNGQKVDLQVTGPLGLPVKAQYGVIPRGQLAIIEMAQASGITLISRNERNPLIATTYGTGELIKKALDDGCRQFIIALGGSATNDGGAGMLQALGMRLLDKSGNEVHRGGGHLHEIHTIDQGGWDSRIAESQFLIASDVQNPMVGLHGATHVFGPQKGATPDIVEQLEQSMIEWADLIEQHTGVRLHEYPGAGAAGGICGAFLAFFPATIKRGIDVVLEYTRIHQYLADADLVITGEGQIDEQTASGKTPMGIAQAAHRYGIPTIAFAGSVGKGTEKLRPYGIQAVFSIVNAPMTLDQAMNQASALLEYTAEQVMRTTMIFNKCNS